MNRIDGTNSDDIQFGTDLSDWIYSYAGLDVIHGGLGKDIFTPGPDGAQKVVADFQDGSDLIDLSGWGVTSFDQLVITEVEPGKTKVSTLDGSHFAYVSPMIPDDGLSLDASDFIYAGTTLHEYSTGFDNIFLTVNQYAVHFGNGGTNWLNFGALVRGTDTATAGLLLLVDDDRLGNGSATLKGVTQHFFDFRNFRGTAGQDTMTGGQANEHLAGLGNGDVIHGGGGNDQVFGNAGADRLYGDAGADVINGGDGYDQMWGGAGADRFVFVAFDTRRDLVRDYEDGTDRLNLAQWRIAGIDDLTIEDLGNDRVLVSVVASGRSFELRGGGESLVAADLDSGDFIFA